MKYYLITLFSLLLTLPAFSQSIKKNADGSATVFFKDGGSSKIGGVEAAYSTTFTFNGAGGSSSAATVYLTKIGNRVTMSIEASVTATTGTNSNQFISNTAMPVAFRPAVNFAGSGMARNGGTPSTVPSFFLVQTTGVILVQRDIAGANWTNTAADSGIQSYLTATWRTN